ncbi:met-10+ like family protein / kelch repeat-containing protein isoform X3 [Tasmannia lanceolata]|uniref:met-10+ like family protein / kelch repeat-containing protein isoform X2 n=1 Tax=Tasmannia lanceolata TaxID=3420 RepID=UPI004062D9FF
MAIPCSTLIKIGNRHRHEGSLGNGVCLLDLETRQLKSSQQFTEDDNSSESSTNGIIPAHQQDDCGTTSSRQFREDANSCGSSTNGIPTHQLTVEDLNLGKTTADVHLGLLREPGCCLSVVKLMIVGEPIEKLFLWGHSACTLSSGGHRQIVVFGGFGGVGRHARRNEALMFDPLSGSLNVINAEGPPSPRLGHTSSAVGECIFVIGGRGDPTQILNDVWVLDTAHHEWKLLECKGSLFAPRHRHAAAVGGSKIYVFGGLNIDTIYSCMHVLDTETFQWSEVSIQGEWPCARHSHSMVENGSQLYMFGGYDGENVLGDLYSFDVGTYLWKKEKTTGKAAVPRFSHSMFIYRNYLGILGGCPVKQQFEEVSLLDLRNHVWKHVTVHSVSKDLLVRSTMSVADDDLVILGGGASCYAFGTKFNEPMKINLCPLISSDDIPCDGNKPKEAVENNNNDFTGLGDSVMVTNERKSPCNNYVKSIFESSNLECAADVLTQTDGHHLGTKHLVLQLEKKYAKLVKDILKKIGWLDLGRKVYSTRNGLHICLPITETSHAFFNNKAVHSVDMSDSLDGCHQMGVFSGKGFTINDASFQLSLNLLMECGGSVQIDDVANVKKGPRAPQKILKEAVCSLIKHKGLQLQLLEQLPTRWERLGDIVVLPVKSFNDPIWDSIGEELWPIVAKALGTRRLARQGRVVPNGTRDSSLEILVGDNGWVEHHENGILYSFDATKCMFSLGNLSEKLRMGRLDCRDEIVVDLFAGIGYFVLPFLVKAKAKLVYACEWNPHAIEALQHNTRANFVGDRCVILEGDNRVTAPKRIADRVCLGLLQSSECSWPAAVRALRPEGGILHVHGNVKDTEEGLWSEYVTKSINSIAKSEGYCWDVSLQHVERVKWYGPHIRHLVADVRCKQMQMQ